MSNENKKGRASARDPDLMNSEVALHRAARRAREQALRSTGYVVVYRDGKIVEDWVGFQYADKWFQSLGIVS